MKKDKERIGRRVTDAKETRERLANADKERRGRRATDAK